MPRLGKWLGLALAATSTLVVLSPAAPALAAPGHHRPVSRTRSRHPRCSRGRPSPPTSSSPARRRAPWRPPRNGRTGPFAGQVIPGFSAVVEGDDGRFYAQPDNGFGTKANSADFLLRIYVSQARVGDRRRGAGPARRPALHLTARPGPQDRLPDRERRHARPAADRRRLRRRVTGPLARRDVLDRGRVRPVPPARERDGQAAARRPCRSRTACHLRTPTSSPVRPRGSARAAASRRWAARPTASYLYPILEGAFTDDADQRRRWIYEFDTTTGHYTGQALGLPDRRGDQRRRRRLHGEEGQAARRRARQLRRPRRCVQADLRGRPQAHRRERATPRSRSSSTSSRSPTPTASAGPPRPARTASVTPSRSPSSRWRRWSSCATATCSSPTTTTIPATTPGTRAPPTTPRW